MIVPMSGIGIHSPRNVAHLAASSAPMPLASALEHPCERHHKSACSFAHMQPSCERHASSNWNRLPQSDREQEPFPVTTGVSEVVVEVGIVAE